MLQFLLERGDLIVAALDALIVAGLAVAAVTPTDKDDTVLARVANLWTRAKFVLPFVRK